VPGDDEKARRRKVLFTFGVIRVLPVTLLLAGLYLVYDEPAAGLFALSYSVLALAGVAVLFRFRRFALFQWTQQVMAFALPVALTFALGGFVGSSAAIMWSFVVVLSAVFGGVREAWWWFGALATAVTLAAVLRPDPRVANNLPAWLVTALFAVNIIGVFLVTFAVLRSFIRDRRRLRELEVSYLNQEVMLRESEKLATLGTLAAGWHTS